MREFETLLTEVAAPGVMLVTFNRPHVANAMNTAMLTEILQLLDDLEGDGSARCVVFTGAGERFFCAGGDLKQRQGMSTQDWKSQHALVEEMVRRFHDFPVPLIAAVNGAAYGGGCEFALTMDFAYAAQEARFCLPETKLGIIPGAGGTQGLLRAAGTRRAKELIFSAREFSADEALRWSIVNEVVPREELRSFTLRRATAIAANAPLAVIQAKKAIRHGAEMSYRDGLYFEVEAYNHLVNTSDRTEGVTAFNERRPPVFTGS